MLDSNLLDDEMLDEYDFSKATRGNPYLKRTPRTITIEMANGSDRLIKVKTIEVTAIVAADGTMTLQLPADISPGTHRITLLIQEDITEN